MTATQPPQGPEIPQGSPPARRRTPRFVWVIMMVSALVMLGAGTWIVVTGLLQPSDTTITPLGDLNSIINSPSPTVTPTASPSITSSPSSIPTMMPTPTPTYANPVQVRIPSLNVKAEVLPVGLDKQKAMDIPSDITKVGWFEPSSNPGSPNGSAVIAGHRDGRVQGHGAFYSIGNLGLNDVIYVKLADGSTLKYKVAARELVDKDKWSKVAPELFAIDGPPRLTLISCGGYYDHNAGGYQSNIIITAIPA